MNNLLEDKNIVAKILNKLSKLCNIPNSGFLAGGAVANTLLNMKYGEDYPINDLDIFREGDAPETLHTPLRTNKLIIQEGYGGAEINYDHGSNYRIIEVSRDGLLNFITITKVYDRENRRDYQYILNGFDFNCCQVGIDLSNNQIYYTEDFVKFLNTQQLEVTALYTPAHTAIRLFKKKDELNCYCDIEKCMELISQPLIGDIRKYIIGLHFAFYFSHKYKDMFIKYYSEIKQYFKLVTFFDDKKYMWKLMNDIHFPSIENENKIDKSHAVNWLCPSRSVPPERLKQWSKYNDIMWTLSPILYNTTDNDICGTLETNNNVMGSIYSPLSFMNAYNITNGNLNKRILSKYKMVLDNGDWTKIIALLNSNFCNCDFTEKHITLIENTIKEFGFIVSNILKYNLTLQESYNLCKDIYRIVLKEGEWITPLIDQSMKENNVLVKPTYDILYSSINILKEKMSKPLIKPIEIIGNLELPLNIIVKEIVSETEMNWAGNKLKNCINDPSQSYKEKIKGGKVKLFVITTDFSCSALELHFSDNNLSYVEKYLLSSCNENPTRYHRIIADIIINEVNADLLLSQYENKIKMYKDISMLNRGLLVDAKDSNKKFQVKTGDTPRTTLGDLDGLTELRTQLEGINRVDTPDVTENNDPFIL
tara:strand:+ start:1213 stop:3162 length:1950 start_codon:yes stop_codon:yes gene_type:complete